MGSALSSEAKFKDLYANLTEKSLPLYLCFMVYESSYNNDHVEIMKKMIEFFGLIEAKYVNKRNRYAIILVKSDLTFTTVDFCEYSNYVQKKCDATKTKNQPTSRPDVYQHAYLNLNWTNANKILLNINTSKSFKQFDTSPYRARLVQNYNINIFDISSLQDLDSLSIQLGNINSKKVEEKYVLLHKFPKSYSQRTEIVHKYATRMRFKSELLTRDYVIKFDKANKLNYNDLFIKESIHFKIEDVPFAQGKEVYCFKGWLLNRNGHQRELRVFKLAKFKEIDLKVNCLAQMIAKYLANEFTKEIGEKIKVEYSEASLVYVGDTVYLVEEFLKGDFLKFTSNEFLLDATQYSEEEKKLIEFSHWSYEWTENNLMIVDLQGFREQCNRFLLTDPAIHSKPSQFGMTDLGANGFARYFLYHYDCCLKDLLKKKIKTTTLFSSIDQSQDWQQYSKNTNSQLTSTFSTLISPKEDPTTNEKSINHQAQDQLESFKNMSSLHATKSGELTNNVNNKLYNAALNVNSRVDEMNPQRDSKMTNEFLSTLNKPKAQTTISTVSTKVSLGNPPSINSVITNQSSMNNGPSGQIEFSRHLNSYNGNNQQPVVVQNNISNPRSNTNLAASVNGYLPNNYTDHSYYASGQNKVDTKYDKQEEKEINRFEAFKTLLNDTINIYHDLIYKLIEISPYDANNVFQYKEKLKGLEKNLAFCTLKNDAIKAYNNFKYTYYNVHQDFRNQVVFARTDRNEIYEGHVNANLHLILNSIIQLYNLFASVFVDIRYRNEIISYINQQLQLEFKHFSDKKRFYLKWIPIFQKFIQENCSHGGQLNVFNELLKKHFSEFIYNGYN